MFREIIVSIQIDSRRAPTATRRKPEVRSGIIVDGRVDLVGSPISSERMLHILKTHFPSSITTKSMSNHHVPLGGVLWLGKFVITCGQT